MRKRGIDGGVEDGEEEFEKRGQTGEIDDTGEAGGRDETSETERVMIQVVQIRQAI